MCMLEEFGVFPGLLHATWERCIDWHHPSNKTGESKADRTKTMAFQCHFVFHLLCETSLDSPLSGVKKRKS